MRKWDADYPIKKMTRDLVSNSLYSLQTGDGPPRADVLRSRQTIEVQPSRKGHVSDILPPERNHALNQGLWGEEIFTSFDSNKSNNLELYEFVKGIGSICVI